ncbi:MAG: methyltransferase, partial [Bacteroidota bacterium]
CGNGVIGHWLHQKYPTANLTVVDDAWLAIESAKLNLPKGEVRFVYGDGLSSIEPKSMDMVVTNPPFHFGYENNIEVSLNLFKEVKKVLKPGGQFIIVANQHLNYATHLSKNYSSVVVLAENNRFTVYKAS